VTKFIEEQGELASYNAGPLPPQEALDQRRKTRAQLIQSQSELNKLRSSLELSAEAVRQRLVAQRRDDHRAAARRILASLAQEN
jgi:hypothetical protein